MLDSIRNARRSEESKQEQIIVNQDPVPGTVPQNRKKLA